MSSTYWPKSLGIELTPSLLQFANRLHENPRLGHVQVSIPGTVSPKMLNELRDDLDTIIHSNLLNTFGENSWNELKNFGRNISRVRCKRVIEHFTLFRNQSGRKTGVHFDKELLAPNQKDLVSDNINRWSDLLGHPVALENTPITENVDEYFHLLIETALRTGSEIVCDVPHFLISAVAAKWDRRQILEIANLLRPTQLHVGGLSWTDGNLKDNHKLVIPWIASFARDLFPEVNDVTIEQSPSLSPRAVSKLAQSVNCVREEPIPDFFWLLQPLTTEMTNSILAKDEVLFPILKNTDHAKLRTEPDPGHSGAIADILQLFEKYALFYYPFFSLKSLSNKLSPPTVLHLASSLTQNALAFSEWYGKVHRESAILRYGENDETKFAAKLSSSESLILDELPQKNEEPTFVFQTENNSWIDVTGSSRIETS